MHFCLASHHIRIGLLDLTDVLVASGDRVVTAQQGNAAFTRSLLLVLLSRICDALHVEEALVEVQGPLDSPKCNILTHVFVNTSVQDILVDRR